VIFAAVLFLNRSGSNSDQTVGSAPDISNNDLTAAAAASAASAKASELMGSPEVIALMNSMIWPEGSAQSVSTSSIVFSSLFKTPYIDKSWPGSNNPTVIKSPLTTLPSSAICQHPISATFAVTEKNLLASIGIDISSLLTPARRYVDWGISRVDRGDSMTSISLLYGYVPELIEISRTGASHYMSSLPVVNFGYCLDNNYVSNYSAYVDNFASFMAKYKGAGSIPSFTDGTASSTNLVGSSTTATSGGTTTTTASTTTTTSTTSYNSYNVNVDYSHFTAEAKKYGYVSVYTGTGTKPVTIVVFKFSDSATMTASAVIAKLATLGYRPATLDEVYTLRTRNNIASLTGDNVVGLGTNLGSNYGYPTTLSTSATGLSRNAGPFATAAYSFAAVKN
jgi:hypothetical protein